MHRFFVPPEWIGEERVQLKGPIAHQLTHVLRLAAKDKVVLLDNSGTEYEVELEKLGDVVEAAIVDRRMAENEPDAGVTLYQGLLKGEKFEWLLQKGTELGVRGFVPVACQRSVPKGDLDKKWERWQRIVVEAAEQSRRGRLPVLQPLIEFEEACRTVQDFSIIPWEGERRRGIRSALQTATELETTEIALFIGPEGGFTTEEVELAERWGVMPVSMGKRILRAETAGLVAATAVMYHLGELGG